MPVTSHNATLPRSGEPWVKGHVYGYKMITILLHAQVRAMMHIQMHMQSYVIPFGLLTVAYQHMY